MARKLTKNKYQVDQYGNKTHKRCSTCGIFRPVDYFNVCDGKFRGSCAECRLSEKSFKTWTAKREGKQHCRVCDQILTPDKFPFKGARRCSECREIELQENFLKRLAKKAEDRSKATDLLYPYEIGKCPDCGEEIFVAYVGRDRDIKVCGSLKDKPLLHGELILIKRGPYGKPYAARRRELDYSNETASRRIYDDKYIHRIFMGEAPNEDLEVDHINGDALDNRSCCNLRWATRSENGCNARANKKGSSKYKGVSWNTAHKRWVAQINVRGQHYYLGSFVDEIEAAKRWNIAAKKHHGEYACLNDIPEETT